MYGWSEGVLYEILFGYDALILTIILLLFTLTQYQQTQTVNSELIVVDYT